MRVLSALLLAVLLSGCATQFGTRMVPAVHSSATVAAPASAVVAPPVAAPVPSQKETFKKRWLKKFFVKRATEK